MGIIVILIIVWIAWMVYQAAYQSGKREGSRKGFGVGFDRGRRSQSTGCLLAVIVLLIALASTRELLATVFGWN